MRFGPDGGRVLAEFEIVFFLSFDRDDALRVEEALREVAFAHELEIIARELRCSRILSADYRAIVDS